MIPSMADKISFLKQIFDLEAFILKSESALNFPQKVSGILKELPDFNFNGMDTIEDCLHLQDTVHQYYRPKEFGKFNLTLVNNSTFFIIVMFMDDLGTEIHDHPFWGSFMPLIGSPYEIQFEFVSTKVLTDHIESGELKPIHSQRINTSQPVEINSNSIHLLSRPRGGQFSLLVGQKLLKDNHFFYHPGLRIKNRLNYNYVKKLGPLLQNNSLTEKKFSELSTELEPDEMLRFLQVMRYKKNQIVIKRVENRIKEIFPELWSYIQAHDLYMYKLQQKLK